MGLGRGHVLAAAAGVRFKLALIAGSYSSCHAVPLSSWHCSEAPPLPVAGAVKPAFRQESMATPRTGSFMHLHLGIDATGLPADLDIHHLVVNQWDDIEVGGVSGQAGGWLGWRVAGARGVVEGCCSCVSGCVVLLLCGGPPSDGSSRTLFYRTLPPAGCL